MRHPACGRKIDPIKRSAPKICFLLLASLVYPVLCAADTCVPDIAAHPDALYAASGAVKVGFLRYSYWDEVTYEQEKNYPATDLLEEISKRLDRDGWVRREEDIWNRRLSTPQIKGWEHFVEGASEEHPQEEHPQMVYQWLGQWKNGRGDIVEYYLYYRFPWNDKTASLDETPPASAKLHVIAKYQSKADAGSVLEAFKKEGISRPR